MIAALMRITKMSLGKTFLKNENLTNKVMIIETGTVEYEEKTSRSDNKRRSKHRLR